MTAGVAGGLVQVFGFTGTERGVFIIIMCLMPVCVATYLFVERHVPDSFVTVN